MTVLPLIFLMFQQLPANRGLFQTDVNFFILLIGVSVRNRTLEPGVNSRTSPTWPSRVLLSHRAEILRFWKAAAYSADWKNLLNCRSGGLQELLANEK